MFQNKNVNKINEKPKMSIEPKPITPKKHIYFENTSQNVCQTNYTQPLSVSTNLPELVTNSKNNIGIVNLKANISDEEKNVCDVKKLIIQRVPGVDLKHDLVTQKLANVQIKPSNKKMLE